MVNKSLHNLGPKYLSDMLVRFTPCRVLRSEGTERLMVPLSRAPTIYTLMGAALPRISTVRPTIRPRMLARARTFTSERAHARAFTRKTLLLRGARERGLRHRFEQVSGQRERERERDTRKNTHTHASTHSLPQAGRPPSMQKERVQSSKGLSSHNTHTHTRSHSHRYGLTHTLPHT